MNHQKIQAQLGALYDGELKGDQRRLVQSHLDGCPDCQKSYNHWVRAAKNLFSTPAPVESEFFVSQVMGRVRALETPSMIAKRGLSLEWLFPVSRWLVPAASLAVLFLAVAPGMPQTISTDTLFSQELREKSPWMVSNGALTQEDTLQMIMEDPQ